MDPAVTVVIPTFNSARTITRLLDSLINQDYKDFETIIVDGGSTDQTVEIASRCPVGIVSVARRGWSPSKEGCRGCERKAGCFHRFRLCSSPELALWISVRDFL